MDSEMRNLAQALRTRYGADVRQILFFGSRARGDALPESDYDCLLVFRNVTDDLKQELDRLACQWLVERGIVLSLMAVSEHDLVRYRYEPFLQNARREGIAA